MEILTCSNNKLIQLPNLPIKINIIHCYHNKLTQLPTLPQQLYNCCCNDFIVKYSYKNIEQNNDEFSKYKIKKILLIIYKIIILIIHMI